MTGKTPHGPIQGFADVQASSRQQRRLERNRLAATESRQRRKQKELAQEERIVELEREVSGLRNDCPTWQSVFHRQLTKIFNQTYIQFPEPVAQFLCYWEMYRITRSHKEFCKTSWIDWGHSRFAANMLRARKKCLQEGYDGFINPEHRCWSHLLTDSELALAGVSIDSHGNFIESTYEDWHESSTYVSSLDWTTTRDRINGWLLDCLQSSETLTKTHKGFLNDSSLDHDDWARLVLKYWSLDEAASGSACEPYPTDGAVGSEGGRHTARVTVTSVKITGMKRANKAMCNESEQESRPAKLRRVVEDPPPDDPLSWN